MDDEDDFFDRLRNTSPSKKINPNPHLMKAMLFENYIRSEFDSSSYQIENSKTNNSVIVRVRSKFLDLRYGFVFGDEPILDTPIDEMPLYFNDDSHDHILIKDWIPHAKLIEKFMSDISEESSYVYPGNVVVSLEQDLRSVAAYFKDKILIMKLSRTFPIHDKITLPYFQSFTFMSVTFDDLANDYAECKNKYYTASGKIHNLHAKLKTDYEKYIQDFTMSAINKLTEISTYV